VIFRCISTPIAWWDKHVIDQFFNFLAWATDATAEEVRDMQNGSIQSYCIWFLSGALLLTLLLLFV
jgi:NADH-quinone oxidoreductase subunit L